MVLFKKDDITYKTTNFIFSYVNAVNLNAMGIILAGKHTETYSELHMVLTTLCHTKDSCSSKMMMLIRSTQINRFTRFYFAKTCEKFEN